MINPVINNIVIYAKDMQKMASFYQKYFGFQAKADPDGRLIELSSLHGGADILILRAGKGMKEGQASVKLVFDVKDIENFREKCIAGGLKFSTIHQAEGYLYANA